MRIANKKLIRWLLQIGNPDIGIKKAIEITKKIGKEEPKNVYKMPNRIQEHFN